MARTTIDIEALVRDAVTAALAQAGVAPAPTPAPAEKAPKARTPFFEAVIAKRVGCAYNAAACKGITFAPNGVGSKQHTTCTKGRAALKRARA